MFGKTPDYEQLRMNMVARQLAGRDITDRAVLLAMRTVPRHLFVPRRERSHAYEDRPLSIGQGQTISQPYIVAFMTQQLQLEPGHRVLEVGTGCGYQSAVLARLGAVVYSLEIEPTLTAGAAKNLGEQGHNVTVLEQGETASANPAPGTIFLRCADGYLGWPAESPFDRIIVAAAPDTLPQTLVDQLGDGGVLIAPVGVSVQDLIKVRRDRGRVTTQSLIPVRFVPMRHV